MFPQLGCRYNYPMKNHPHALLLVLLLFAPPLVAQEMPNPLVAKSFVILASSPQYEVAKTSAEKASQTLKIKLELRGLLPNAKTGLTADKQMCLASQFQEFPCYQARGKYDDGEYISIEYSSAYKEMKRGLFIVLAYSGEKKEAASILKKIKTTFKDAYIKPVKIYMAGE